MSLPMSPKFAAAYRYARRIPHMANTRLGVRRLFPMLYAAIGTRG